MNYQKSYSPSRPIRSFQDLEVYQKLLAISVAITKKVTSEKITALALDLPVKIATAHSLRFSDQTKAIQILEEIMLECNVLTVYLEQYRDIENTNKVIPSMSQIPGVPTGLEGSTFMAQTIREDSSTSVGMTEEAVGMTEEAVGMTIEPEFFEEQIKTLLTTRGKILRLQFSWKKFMGQNKNNQNA